MTWTGGTRVTFRLITIPVFVLIVIGSHGKRWFCITFNLFFLFGGRTAYIVSLRDQVLMVLLCCKIAGIRKRLAFILQNRLRVGSPLWRQCITRKPSSSSSCGMSEESLILVSCRLRPSTDVFWAFNCCEPSGCFTPHDSVVWWAVNADVQLFVTV